MGAKQPPPASPATIREVQPDDALQIAELFAELDHPLTQTEAAERLGRGVETVFVALEGDRIAGLIAVSRLLLFARARPIARISALMVRADPQLRLSARLMDRACLWARETGCEGVEVTSAMRRERAEAHRFYQDYGFERLDYRFYLALR